jgi:hypothetical protein
VSVSITRCLRCCSAMSWSTNHVPISKEISKSTPNTPESRAKQFVLDYRVQSSSSNNLPSLGLRICPSTVYYCIQELLSGGFLEPLLAAGLSTPDVNVRGVLRPPSAQKLDLMKVANQVPSALHHHQMFLHRAAQPLIFTATSLGVWDGRPVSIHSSV